MATRPKAEAEAEQTAGPSGPRTTRAVRLLVVALLVTSLVACQPGPPPAGPVAQAYAAAWSRADHQAMWELLTEESRERVGAEGFLDRLPLIAAEMSLTALDAVAGEATHDARPDGSPDPRRATVPLDVTFTTSRVGTFSRVTVLRLVLVGEEEEAAWRIDWSPEMILPTLSPGRLVRMTRLPTSRGRIVAREGTELATFVDAGIVGVVPEQVQNEAGMLASLSEVLGMSVERIRETYTQPWVQPHHFVPIRTLSPAALEAARARLGLIEGVQLRPQRVRSYPTGLAAQTIGYVGEATEEEALRREARGVMPGDVIGKQGLEAALDEALGGTYGWRLTVIEPNADPVETLGETPPIPGLDVVLALDPALQRAAEDALGDHRGAVVAQDPWSGEIHVIASRPSFDPDLFITGEPGAIVRLNEDPLRPLFNRATFGQYATGSAFKMVTASAALRHGLYAWGQSIPCPARWTGYGDQWVQLNHETGDLGPI
ncbi:MAG TPA: penicillin-binding transpeptidase domain-containing protein, partial [Candidatus Limnocylindrales bacterium]|nr:penicillin-binding transpeptidase domain-containing protein [Candidatus Limnocylindrales bacterium]